jgi:hypothetical protein
MAGLFRSSMASNVHSLLNPADTAERPDEDQQAMADDRKRRYMLGFFQYSGFIPTASAYGHLPSPAGPRRAFRQRLDTRLKIPTWLFVACDPSLEHGQQCAFIAQSCFGSGWSGMAGLFLKAAGSTHFILGEDITDLLVANGWSPSAGSPYPPGNPSNGPWPSSPGHRTPVSSDQQSMDGEGSAVGGVGWRDCS